ncbi:aldo/keto reductase [Aeromicrobium sp. Leaf291]|uniref:aldo/keto reductase n=1 Tax=Aeromicrobium sp. Leaf291 TaxID=1736325 RepID=UPI0009E827DF|nr:aldo/keto reductase [Aeromicrobium sp. Leaf291]
MRPHQVALAWHFAQAPVVVPIPGASRPESAKNSAETADLELSDDELQTIESGLST